MKKFYFPLFIVFFLILTLYLKYNYQSTHFTLHNGDLLFQDIDCGELCNGISEVTYGFHHTYVSHVGIVVIDKPNDVNIIEAIGDKVQRTPLNKFLQRSLDENKKPRVMVGRLNSEYQKLLKPATKYAINQIGKPYNESFSPYREDSYYCSELIYDAFKNANEGKSIFKQNIMTFKDSKTHQTTNAWKQYFNSIHSQIPEGEIGTNPGMMSRESVLTIIHFYGNLRTNQLESMN